MLDSRNTPSEFGLFLLHQLTDARTDQGDRTNYEPIDEGDQKKHQKTGCRLFDRCRQIQEEKDRQGVDDVVQKNTRNKGQAPGSFDHAGKREAKTANK